MGNHKMEHCWTQINATSPKMSEAKIVKTQRQPVGIEVTQSFNAVIITIRVEMVITPSMDVVKNGMVIGSVLNVSHGLSGFLAKRNLSRSSRLPTINTRVVGTPQMVFTNPIMIIHDKTTNQP